MEPEGSLPYSQVPATYPILSQLHPVLKNPSNFHNNILLHQNIFYNHAARKPGELERVSAHQPLGKYALY
jgi:hypothetical protein